MLTMNVTEIILIIMIAESLLELICRNIVVSDKSQNFLHGDRDHLTLTVRFFTDFTKKFGIILDANYVGEPQC